MPHTGAGTSAPAQLFAWRAYDIDRFEQGSVANRTAPIIGNVFGFKAPNALRPDDRRIRVAHLATFQGPATGIVVKCERLDKYVRPLLGATTKPQLGRSGRKFRPGGLRGSERRPRPHEGRREHQLATLQGCRVRFLYGTKAVNKASAANGEVKGHCRNVTAGTMEAMIMAPNEGRDVLPEGPRILQEAYKGYWPLNSAIDTWGDIAVHYESTDTADFAPTATAA